MFLLFYFIMRSNELNELSMSRNTNLKKYQLLYTCSGLISMYKNGNHGGCCVMFKLYSDIETNPGPPIHHVDPTLTTKVAYSQGILRGIFGRGGNLYRNRECPK